MKKLTLLMQVDNLFLFGDEEGNLIPVETVSPLEISVSSREWIVALPPEIKVNKWLAGASPSFSMDYEINPITSYGFKTANHVGTVYLSYSKHRKQWAVQEKRFVHERFEK